MDLNNRVMFRFVSPLSALIVAALASGLGGCESDSNDEQATLSSESTFEAPQVRAFCELEFACHAEHYDSVEHCVEVLSLDEDASEPCESAYHDLLTCLTVDESCSTLRDYYLKQPADNYPCYSEDQQGDACL